MTAYVALLRAVNLGGSSTLPMADLKALAEAAGLARVRTYIASGNLVFASDASEGTVKAALEEALKAHAKKPIGIVVRNATEMAAIVARNPFPEAPGSRNVVIFLDAPPPADAIERATGMNAEAMRLGPREIHVDYVDGIGRSKLTIPAAKTGTGRNMNTVKKLAEMAAAS